LVQQELAQKLLAQPCERTSWKNLVEGTPFVADLSAVRAIVFDLDGTLIDSKDDLILSVNAALAELGRPALPNEQIASYIGQGAPVLIRRALGDAASDEECRRGLEFFLAYYETHKMDHTTLYPGVREGLAQLAGFPLVILTNKPARISLRILQELKLANLFRAIYGGNSFSTKKPDPLGMNTILGELGVRPRETVLVGDSEIDVQTARNAGTWVATVTYGFGAHRLDAFPPDFFLGSLIELPAFLNHR
jgi:phosphoglycolate phosphatase